MSDSQPNYRQDPPEPRPMPGTMPTCPLCGITNDPSGDPDAEPVTKTPRREPLAEQFPFTCTRCWTVFAGTDQEWQRMREQREAYKSVRHRLDLLAGDKP